LAGAVGIFAVGQAIIVIVGAVVTEVLSRGRGLLAGVVIVCSIVVVSGVVIACGVVVITRRNVIPGHLFRVFLLVLDRLFVGLAPR